MVDLAYRVSELERRLANVNCMGVVSDVDAATKRCRVKVGGVDFGGWLQWCALAAGQVRMWRAPKVGEQCLVFSPNGEPAAAKVIPATYCDTFPAPADDPNLHLTQYPDGSVVQYDFAAGQYDFDIQGNFKVKASGDIAFDAGGEIALSSATKITLDAADLISLVAALITQTAENTSLTISPEGATSEGQFDLGGADGEAVARVGDLVQIDSGSSAGTWPIISGSDKVRAG